MQIIVNNFADGKPSARLIVLGNCAFWFANKDLIAFKNRIHMYRYNPGGGYASSLSHFVPSVPYKYSIYPVLNTQFPVYRPELPNFHPEISMFAGSGAKAFAINFGHAQIYFSYNKVIGINVYDKIYVIDIVNAESSTMKKHINILNVATGSESVSPEVLDGLIDRYFGMFERPISCL